MERYIDAELAKEALTGWETDPLDEEIERAIDNIPTADVVPRAEIESTLKYSKDTIKTEVAREIFEEIETCLYHPFNDMPDDVHYQIREQDYDEIKKKYTEGGT